MLADRAITPEEAAVVRWLLENAPVSNGAAYLANAPEDLHVTEQCDCGCYSLFFGPVGPGHEMIGDAICAYNDGALANLMLWANAAGAVVWLEIWDMTDNQPRQPVVENLRTWEEHGRLMP